ncbi:carboxymuconolactone decarboxylase family protein [Nannocystis punicea]|uniref:Carboxymuconolactone decarboxylase family protein n=1 Tax=Nannocystis punicea TaxID=2995304 RepID=A0ABY7HG65_9BACT|nr:carboxymuconolactone decarboxylase family protein [Nannocystis poenicansa]WAS98065.1 carboxymuconolactone decarboxylase family protein [Nannocystis poenicansa]
MNAKQETQHLSARDRELATVAALVALGEVGRGHLPQHVDAALDAGARRQEIVEMIGTLSQASGTPTAVNGIAAAAKVFAARDAAGKALPGEAVLEPGDAPVAEGNDARYERAKQVIQQVYPAGPTDDTYTSVERIAPHFWRNMATVFYNDLFLHPGATIATRELGIFAAYVAMSTVPLQLRWHTHGALNNGWSPDQLREVVRALEPYVGHANAYQSRLALEEVVAGRSAVGAPRATEALPLAALEPAAHFSARERALVTLAALITRATSPELLRLKIAEALAAGMAQADVWNLISGLERVAGSAAASRARLAAESALEAS